MKNINDGGTDAPLTPRDGRILAAALLGLIAVSVLVAAVLTHLN